MHHPDKSTASSDNFLPIQEAYEFLRENKDKYDKNLKNEILNSYSSKFMSFNWLILVEQQAEKIEEYEFITQSKFR